MHSAFIFPYGITLNESGVINVFPAARVLFQSSDGEWASLFLIIDSGARISALPKSDAISLGINPEEGTPMSIKGIGKEYLTGWRHEVPIRLGNSDLHLPVVFLDQESSPRILGREGIFDRFTIIFEEHKKRSGFLKKSSQETQRVSHILDTLQKR